MMKVSSNLVSNAAKGLSNHIKIQLEVLRICILENESFRLAFSNMNLLRKISKVVLSDV